MTWVKLIYSFCYVGLEYVCLWGIYVGVEQFTRGLYIFGYYTYFRQWVAVAHDSNSGNGRDTCDGSNVSVTWSCGQYMPMCMLVYGGVRERERAVKGCVLCIW